MLRTIRELYGARSHDDSLQRSRDMTLSNMYIDLLSGSAIKPGIQNDLATLLHGEIAKTLKSGIIDSSQQEAVLLLGKGLHFIAQRDQVDKSMFQELCQSASLGFARSPKFLQAMLCITQASPSLVDFTSLDQHRLLDNLVINLSGPSHDLRLLSLELLETLYRAVGGEAHEMILLALTIEQTPFTLENARSSSVNIRKMASVYESSATDSWTKAAIPALCFGLLHVRLVPAWEDACNALEVISKVKGSDDLIMETAAAWLAIGSSNLDAAGRATNQPSSETSDFMCPNLHALEESAAQIWNDVRSANTHFQAYLDLDTQMISLDSVFNRAQALRVLDKIPQLAEKRSRVLVPILLNWTKMYDADSETAPQESEESDGISQISVLPLKWDQWSRKEQKALLGLFAQFTNPSVLYKSEDVHSAFLGLLCNGDVDIQKCALKALFAWKHSYVKSYEDHLLNILDDARFREELAVFLNVGKDDGGIREEHRPGLMPILLRLIYGRIVARSGSAAGRRSQEVKRKAALTALARFGETELQEFIHIVLGLLTNTSVIQAGSSQLDEQGLSHEVLAIRRQLGVVNMLGDVLETLPNMLSPFTLELLSAILYCGIRSTRELSRVHQDLQIQPVNSSLFKSVRQESLRCLNLLFATNVSFDWKKYASIIVTDLILPRLENLPIESAQAVSMITRLVATWCSSNNLATIFLLPHAKILETMADCLAVLSAKDVVKVYILENIFRPFIDFANNNELLQAQLRESLGLVLLNRLAITLRQNPSKECLESTVRSVINVAPFIEGNTEGRGLIETSIDLLKQPSRNVNPRLKGEILRLLHHFVPTYNFSGDETFYNQCYFAISTLFSFFKDAENRNTLVLVFTGLTRHVLELSGTGELCKKLNSFLVGRLNEPDFDTRLSAFDAVNAGTASLETMRQWHPVLHNMLFFVRDNDELAIRSSASLSIRRFIRLATAEGPSSDALKLLLAEAVMPVLQKGMREPSELVRAEYVAILAEITKSSWPRTIDMQVLLGADEESSFFNNVLHIQQHRRIRALRRLSGEAHKLSGENIGRFCIPLIENYFTEVEEDTHILGSEAIMAMESLAGGLEWYRYRPMLQRMITEAPKLDSKLRIRALSAVTNALYKAGKVNPGPQIKDSGLEIDVTASIPETLGKSLPDQEALSASLQSILTTLTDNIHYREDTTVDLRVLLSVIAVKLILVLPPQQIANRLPSVIMDVCNILRSKAQEARDDARRTLAEISAIIGPAYFGFILKQLRTSLQRGSQIHVMSYTIHSILVSVAPKFKAGDLDYCIPDFMNIIIDSIFGVVAQEKEAQDYISKMKEVKKKTLGYDSLELLSSMVTLQHVASLVRPIKAQLDEPRPKVEKVDELFRRLREGLRNNKGVNDQQFLTLCYELLRDVYKEKDEPHRIASLSSYKTICFSLELLRRILDKHETLKTAGNLAGFMPMLAFSVNHPVEEVQMSAFRLLTSIIKVPLPELDASAADYVKQAKRIIEGSASTNTPLAQAALRLVASILRERPDAVIKQSQFETHMAIMLERIRPDLQEPAKQGERDRQVAAFNFLKAILARGVLIKEVYDVMDIVREVMITSHEHPIPDLARSVYSRFILDYFPEEGKGLAKQLDFLVTNLQYPNPRGRQSVMEVVLFLLTKTPQEAVQTMASDLFLPVVLVLATDESNDCRDAAKILLRRVFERADKERTKLFRTQLTKWIDSEGDQMWRKIGFQCWKTYFDVHETASKEAATVHAHIVGTLSKDTGSKNRQTSLLLFDAMQLLKRICELFPSIAFASATSDSWTAVTDHLSLAMPLVKLPSAQLIGMYFTDLARTTAKSNALLKLPLTGSGGLQFDNEDAMRIANVSLSSLHGASDDAFVEQSVQNLAFLGRVSVGGDSQDVLDHLFEQAAAVVRSDSEGSTLKSKLAAAKLLAALCKLVPVDGIRASLPAILLPLQNLTDTSIAAPFTTDIAEKTRQEDLVNTAQELLDALQAKFGTQDFVSQMSKVQREIRERREGRKAKRRIEAVTAPEKAGREKQKKHETKKVKRKEKSAMYAGRRKGY